MVETLEQSLALLFSWSNILALTGGTLLGLTVGAIPGMQGSMVVAIGLPVTLFIPPETGILLLLGIYKAANFGGSIPAILINTPGTIAAVATTFDGYPLTQQGKAGKALKMALYSSTIGDAFSDVITLLVAVHIAKLALRFGPFEYFGLLLFTYIIIAAVSRGSTVKGLMGAALGMAFATIGTDPIQGYPRFIFGYSDLKGGISLVAFLMGLYALSQIIVEVEGMIASGKAVKATYTSSPNPDDNRVTFEEFRACIPTIVKSGCIGTVLGALPGIGPAISSFVCYGEAKRSAKNPDRFGKGALEGVAAAEGGNSSVCGANLIPLLTLGIPGDMVAAVLLGAFMIHGMQPGPLLFQESGVVVYAILLGMILIDVVMFIFGEFFIKVLIAAIGVSKAVLYPVVLLLCVGGMYAYNSDMFDVQAMLVMGIIGYVLRRLDFPLAPMAIGFVLGRMTEEKLRQSLILARGNPLVFFSHPIAVGFLIVTIVTVAWYIRSEYRRGR
jgi:putative tricarboxylic transport membrane protein